MFMKSERSIIWFKLYHVCKRLKLKTQNSTIPACASIYSVSPRFRIKVNTRARRAERRRCAGVTGRKFQTDSLGRAKSARGCGICHTEITDNTETKVVFLSAAFTQNGQNDRLDLLATTAGTGVRAECSGDGGTSARRKKVQKGHGRRRRGRGDGRGGPGRW